MRKLSWLIGVVAVVALAAGCGSSSSSGSSSGSSSSGGGSSSKVLVGAGSTFVAPLVQSWSAAYVKTSAAVTVTYGAIGSGGDRPDHGADG